ncbi:hypothetical protein [Cohnella candidum]|uniref:Uncharacterized protein n=1 Tax=Cohnella candidum TaxID=2674991 RepID=A0A3G3JZ27_9BACL|nr:hypothetical protein [Cohnella candidum]AYQ73500.1 hypothetical protein EAV92_13490 [Cohnella candidum]
MSEMKPDWYARLRNGPFAESGFDSKMALEVEERALGENPGKILPRRRARRLNRWAATGVFGMAIVVIGLFLVSGLADKAAVSPRGSNGTPEMTESYVIEHLRVGMTESEVKKAFGKSYNGLSVKRDFAQPHEEDPLDMSTWSAVDVWRYDYGVMDGYQVNVTSDLEKDDGFDTQGLINGSLESQLVIVWKDRLVNRAIFKYSDGAGVNTSFIGPQASTEVPTPSPSVSPDPPLFSSLDVRAFADSSFGRLELRPDDGLPEKIQTLGAPSCLGQETDYYVTGSYGVYFKSASGQESRIGSLPNLEIIQKENQAFAMTKLDFPDGELFLLIPRYTDCHGLEFHVYGVDKKTGEASAFTFEEAGRTVEEWTTSPVNLPTVDGSELVVEGGRAAGQDGTTRLHFEPDWTQHKLVLTKIEKIP